MCFKTIIITKKSGSFIYVYTISNLTSFSISFSSSSSSSSFLLLGKGRGETVIYYIEQVRTYTAHDIHVILLILDVYSKKCKVILPYLCKNYWSYTNIFDCKYIAVKVMYMYVYVHSYHFPYGAKVSKEVSIFDKLSHEAKWLLQSHAANHVHNMRIVALSNTFHCLNFSEEITPFNTRGRL